MINLERIAKQGNVEVPSDERDKILHLMHSKLGQRLDGRKIHRIVNTAAVVAEAEASQKTRGDTSADQPRPQLKAEIVERDATEMSELYNFLSYTAGEESSPCTSFA